MDEFIPSATTHLHTRTDTHTSRQARLNRRPRNTSTVQVIAAKRRSVKSGEVREGLQMTVTIPKEIYEGMGLARGDVVEWRVMEEEGVVELRVKDLVKGKRRQEVIIEQKERREEERKELLKDPGWKPWPAGLRKPKEVRVRKKWN